MLGPVLGGGDISARCATHPDVGAVQTCSRCGNFVCGLCLVTAPGKPALCQTCWVKLGEEPLPWDQRSEVGLFRAYWRTCLLVMGSPSQTFARSRGGGTLGGSFAFTAVSGFVGYATTILFYGVLIFGMAAIPGAKDESLQKLLHGAGPAWVVAGMAGYMLFLILMLLGVQVVMGSLEHALIKSLGGEGSWATTMRAYSLSMAPNLVGLVPLCSVYVMPIWSIVARVFAYKHMHQVSWGRAVAAALGPSLALGCLCFGFYAFAIAMAATSRSS